MLIQENVGQTEFSVILRIKKAATDRILLVLRKNMVSYRLTRRIEELAHFRAENNANISQGKRVPEWCHLKDSTDLPPMKDVHLHGPQF